MGKKKSLLSVPEITLTLFPSTLLLRKELLGHSFIPEYDHMSGLMVIKIFRLRTITIILIRPGPYSDESMALKGGTRLKRA